jgi:hypothetical protein
MRISFDLDDTLICRDAGARNGAALSVPLRWLVGTDPLRHGAAELLTTLKQLGHEVWVYTSSHRKPRAIRWWLRAHGVKIDRVVNGAEHDHCFGFGSTPSKRPHAFQIDLHIDNSRGVAMEGEQFGFRVCVIDPNNERWPDAVLAAVDAVERSITTAR